MRRRAHRSTARSWAMLSALLAFLVLACPAAADGAVAFHRQYVDLPHGQVHVLTSRPVAGVASATPLACLAPNPASGDYFRLFMAALGADRIMIAPDYPGLGRSDPMDEAMDIPGYAAVMGATFDALGFGGDGGRIDVCGYHTGAFVAQELAIRRPDLVRRVILVGIPYYEGEERRAMYEKNVVRRPLPETLDELQDTWDFTVTHRQPGVSLDRAYGNFLDAARARPVRHQAYHAAFSYDGGGRAPLLAQPVLILNTHGSLAEETRALAPFFPDATLVELPELHHGVFDVGAARLAEVARPFLDRP